jgi:hypothetical protein
MSLNKEVCKICIDRRGGVPDEDAPKSLDVTWHGWNYGLGGDEEDWEEGLVYCRYNERVASKEFSAVSVDGQPPAWCPYDLEHTVSA